MPHKSCDTPFEFEAQTTIDKESPTSDTDRKPKNKKIFFVAISVILLILLIGIMLWIFLPHDRGDKVSAVITSATIVANESSDTYTITVTGTSTNNSSKALDCVQITISIYDSDGNVVGTAIDTLLYLDAGETWNFHAVGITHTISAVACRIADITYR